MNDVKMNGTELQELQDLMLQADAHLAKVSASGDDLMRIAVTRQSLRDAYVKIFEFTNKDEGEKEGEKEGDGNDKS